MMIGVNDILAILPEIVMILGASALLLFDFAVPKGKKHVIGYLSLGVILLAALASCYLARNGYTGTVAFNNMFVADGFSFFFKAILYVATALTILMSISSIKKDGIEEGEYYTLMLFSLSGMMIMASGTDLLSLYLGVELMSLPVYVLAGFKRNDPRSSEGAMKYVILGAFASGIMLFGISLVYGLTGTTELSAISAALSGGAGEVNAGALGLTLVLLVAGFGFKIAGVPFHMWAPDAYEGAPTPITAFMSAASKAAAFAVILRIFLDGFGPVTDQWVPIITVVAVLSMALGNIVALAQTNIKRMLAYSSIGHGGYALLGVIAGGAEGSSSVMFYMLVYILMNMGIFACITMMRGNGAGDGELITDYKGLSKRNGTMAIVMLILLFSLAGIPPTGGFVGKFYVFMALIHAGMIKLAVVGVLFSAVAAYFYIRVIMLMYMKEPEGEFSLSRSLTTKIVVVVSAAGVLILGVLPGSVLEIVQKATGLFIGL